jgi:hypothetical protein
MKKGRQGRRKRAEGLGGKGGCGIFMFPLFYGKPFGGTEGNIKKQDPVTRMPPNIPKGAEK